MALLQLLTAVTASDGSPVTAPGPDGQPRPILQPAPDSPLTERIFAAAQSGFIHQTLKLDRCARNLAIREGRLPAAEAAALLDPVYLFLSQEDGGFARHGFWLNDRYIACSYINMVVDESSLERGQFELTFCHELGHTQIRMLVGDITAGPCRKMHQSHVVTDYPTALDEGWAEHVEPLVVDQSENPWLRGQKQGRIPDLLATWLSNVDGALRQDGVRRNRFVFDKALPEAALEPAPDRYHLFLDAETSATFLTDRLKNGQAMLACEGVGATLLYRLVKSEPLRNRYREQAFYQRFLADGERVTDPAERFSPLENVYLKLFAALLELGKRPLHSSRPYLAELFEAYCSLFPDEAEPLWQLFVESTWGAPVSHEASRTLEALARQGRLGDLPAFQAGIGPAIQLLTELRQGLIDGRLHPGEALGPELWILNPSFMIARPWWSKERNIPLSINLNTASAHELMTPPGIDLPLAVQVLEARSKAGYFESIEQFVDAAESPALLPILHAMQQQMAEAGDAERP